MKVRTRKVIGSGLAASLCLGLLITGPTASAEPPPPLLVEDFESGLPQGKDGPMDVGFYTFQDPTSTVEVSTTDAPPSPVPDSAEGNTVARLDLDVDAYAGVTHAFGNETLDEWVAQDWSAHEGISFWLYGNNSGAGLFVDVLDNRTDPEGDADDAERFTVAFVDDFSGWRLMQFPFADMTRKEVGNGAPNDGFGLSQTHGWALVSITN